MNHTQHRFEFGANWERFLKQLNDSAVEEAKVSLLNMLEKESLKGQRFLDIGSGSGLFSLAARLLGAYVHSFDNDPRSVQCALTLKQRYCNEDAHWVIQQGTALDRDYLDSLGRFDVVYSWGVLHHTGAMWQALENVIVLVASGGKLFISIYNDQGWLSRYWKTVKRLYNQHSVFRVGLRLVHLPLFLSRVLLRVTTGRLNPGRGMSLWYDYLDWLGGYPFETAKPEQVFEFYRDRGFVLRKLKTCGGRSGCNEFVFERSA